MLKRGRTYWGILVILGVIVFGAVTLARGGSTNAISITNTSTSTGQISVSGSFTLASGYSYVSVNVYARPTSEAAGEGGFAGAAVTPTMTGGTYTASVAVPSGSAYDVQAILKVTDGSGNEQEFFSSTVTSSSVP